VFPNTLSFVDGMVVKICGPSVHRGISAYIINDINRAKKYFGYLGSKPGGIWHHRYRKNLPSYVFFQSFVKILPSCCLMQAAMASSLLKPAHSWVGSALSFGLGSSMRVEQHPVQSWTFCKGRG
jgi:hypothetical protein